MFVLNDTWKGGDAPRVALSGGYHEPAHPWLTRVETSKLKSQHAETSSEGWIK